MPKEPKSIVIDNFQRGIASSPFAEGFSDIRNIDIESRPGSARLNFALQNCLPASVTTTFTASSTTDILTTAASFEYNGHASGFRAVTLSVAGGTLPTASGGNLAAGTIYYLVEQTATTYKLARDLSLAHAGTTIDLTSNGSGTMTITSVNMTRAKYIVYEPFNAVYFLQDDIGQVWTTTYGSSFDTWYLLSGNTLTSAHGNGLVLFNNYLLAFTDGLIESYGNLTTVTIGDPTKWTTSWQTIFDGGGSFDHVPFYSPINGLVYWSEYKGTTGASTVPSGSSGLGSLFQVPGQVFDPATGATFTFTSGVGAGNFALQLPTYQKITSIILVGSNLMLGTNQNLVYPWDTYSATYGLPLILPEQNVTSMSNIGNYLYVACGYRGNIYVFDGYTTTLLCQIPPYISGIPQNIITIGSLTKHNGKLYFTVGCKGCSGVWSVNPNTKALNFEHEVSLLTYGTSSTMVMGTLFSVGNDQLLSGWFDNDSSTYGLDANLMAGNYYQSGYTAYYETTFFTVGIPNVTRALSVYDIMMGAVLQTGQGIKIYSRGDNLTAYSATPDATFDFTTYGALDSIKLNFGKSFVNVQFKIALTTGSNSTTTPQLNSINVT